MCWRGRPGDAPGLSGHASSPEEKGGGAGGGHARYSDDAEAGGRAYRWRVDLLGDEGRCALSPEGTGAEATG